jgi:DNA ligase-1
MKDIAFALEQARSTSSRLAKTSAIAAGLRSAAREGPAVLRMAVRLAMGRVLPPSDSRTLGVGWRLIAGVALALTGASDEELRAAARKHGDLGDAVFVLYEPLHVREPRPGVTLAELATAVDAIAETGVRGDKSALLLAFLSRATPLEAKYIVKGLLGEMRTGAVEGVIVAAIAEAFDAPAEEVRRAHGLVADAAEVAVLAYGKRLDDARVRPGHPVAFMLATPLETVATPPDWGRSMAEDKLDGVRAQVHVKGGEVSIFARGLERVTQTFPEVADGFRASKDVVLDGEIVAVGPDGRVRPFQTLQARLNRVAPDKELLASVPARFVAFDALVVGDVGLVERPWAERREALEGYARETATLTVNPIFAIHGSDEIDAAFERARARGHEGLVIKRVDAHYEASKRGQSWIKIKKAFATLDVVVTAVEEGHGKRAGMLSDYTFAVRTEDGGLVDVGKAYSGLTDEEIAELAKVFVAETQDQRGGRRLVRPTVVIEAGFDGIQRSKRHESGFALRFPRILRIRNDKRPEEIDTVATVEALFRSQVASGHREEPQAGALPRGRRARQPSPQLSLFSDTADVGEGADRKRQE